MLRSLPLFFAAIAVLALSGCLAQERRDINLEATLSKYESTVRWGRIQDAYLFARLKADQAPAIPSGLDEIRVAGYEVLRPPVQLDSKRVTQTVEIQYLFRDRQVVKTLIDQQVWQYDDEAGRWYLASPVPMFR